MEANLKATYYPPRVLVFDMKSFDDFADRTSPDCRLLYFTPNRYISHRAGEYVETFEVRFKGRKQKQRPYAEHVLVRTAEWPLALHGLGRHAPDSPLAAPCVSHSCYFVFHAASA